MRTPADLELPTGETVRCDPIPMTDSIRFIELLEKAGKADLAAMNQIMREFPKAVGSIVPSTERCGPPGRQ